MGSGDFVRGMAMRVPRLGPLYRDAIELRLQRDQMIAEREELQTRLAEALKRQDDLHALNLTLIDEHAAQTADYDEARRKLEALATRSGAEVIDAKAEAAHAESARRAIELKLYVKTADLNHALIVIEGAHQERIAATRSLRADVEQLQADVAGTKADLTRAKADLTRAKADLTRAQTEIDSKTRQVEGMTSEVHTLNVELNAAKLMKTELGATERRFTQMVEENMQALGGSLDAVHVEAHRAAQVGTTVEQFASLVSGRLSVLSARIDDLHRLERRVGDGSKESSFLRRQYLDLLESSLVGRLSNDPNMAPWGAADYDEGRRLIGRDWPASAQTMIGVSRMRNLRNLAEEALADGVPGDFIETGVWRGGACIYLRGVLEAYGDRSRKVWVADSFNGLPPPEPDAYPADEGDEHHTVEALAISLDDVKGNFARYGLLDGQVEFLPGWFKDTLPKAPIDKLAILRLDGDMYSSTIEAISALYDKVSVGGFIIVDDYVLPACREAIEDFRGDRKIQDPMTDVDGAAVFWKKSA